MDTPPRPSWLAWSWFAPWSWRERLIVAAVWLLPLGTLIVGGRAWGWLAGLFALAACGVLHLVVWLHGGWRLLGPHFFYDVVRLARRGRSTALRIVYIAALFLALAVVFENEAPRTGVWRPNDFAHVSEKFAYSLFVVQNVAILILTPAYLAGCIAEERERGTLDLLFTTQMSSTEIILGKLFSRIVHLCGLVLAGFPILGFLQFWGGIDMLLLAGNLVNTLLNILTLGSICLLISTLTQTVNGAVMTAYGLILPFGSCCGCALKSVPFVLLDSRTNNTVLTVQDLGPLLIMHAVITAICLGLACISLRDGDPTGPTALTPPRRRREDAPKPVNAPAPTPKPAREPERIDLFENPYVLPPVSDNALLWKERFLNGPAIGTSPMMIVPTLPLGIIMIVSLGTDYAKGLLGHQHAFQVVLEFWFYALRFSYCGFLACYILGVAFRATASIARERQQQTLEPLLLLPIERRQILWAKFVGNLWRGWPWLVLLLANVTLGVCIGVYHPFSAVLLFFAPWPMILFVLCFGLMLSATCSTVLRANLVMVLVVFVLVITSAAPAGLGPVAQLETFAFSYWIPRDPITPAQFGGALAMMGCYALLAGGCWAITRYRFNRPYSA